MARYNGNNAYILWNGIDLSGFFTDAVGFNPSNSSQDVTAGAGVTHVQKNPGLDDTNITVNIYYDDDDATRNGYLPFLKPGTKATLIYGPEGNVSGNPVHEQSCILTNSNGPNIDITKAKVMLELTFEGADAPVRNIYDDVFA
jgi:hypothetical protein